MTADRAKVVPLIKTARGQLDGILKMIDEDRYCIDISNQVLAVISILGKANKEIIRAHLAGCVKDSLTGGTPEEVETKLDEMCIRDSPRTGSAHRAHRGTPHIRRNGKLLFLPHRSQRGRPPHPDWHTTPLFRRWPHSRDLSLIHI